MSPYSVRAFLLATIMFLDDTDLLCQDGSPEDKDEELIESVQRDVKVWREVSNPCVA